MKLSSTGFTLIELMIVVAIVGILAAVAVPIYQIYVARSQAARVMTESGGLRSLIEACINEGKTTIGTDASSCDPSAVGSTLLTGSSQTGATLPTGTGVPQVTFAAGGGVTIVATFGHSSIPLFATENLTWTRSPEGVWTCATSISMNYRPKGCD